MAKMLHYVAKLHEHKRCLGTREILAEEDEIQPNERVFKKVRCWVDHFQLS
jgi:long-chain acyl-CoA synthetase